MRDSVPFMPAGPVAVVSCHVERPLDDDAWRRFDALQRRRPGGFDVIALIRPPDPAHGEDEQRWLERARLAASRAPLGLHTHWTSPVHARPTGGDPAARVRFEAAWMRERGLDPVFFCGGGWYTDGEVRAAVSELGLVDCTSRDGAPAPGVLPTTPAEEAVTVTTSVSQYILLGIALVSFGGGVVVGARRWVSRRIRLSMGHEDELTVVWWKRVGSGFREVWVARGGAESTAASA